MIRLLIIEDELIVRNTLCSIIERYCSDVEIIGKADGVSVGLRMIRELKPDVILLDIKMQDGSGFDLLERIHQPQLRVIFISAHDQFALKAFKYRAVDFILKPVDPFELKQTLERTQTEIQRGEFIETMRVKNQQLVNHKRITVRTEQDVHFIYTKDIIRCQSDGNYTRIVLTNGSIILVGKTLKVYDELLNGCGFFRAHKSHLVNMSHVVRLDKSNGGMLFFHDGSYIPLASRKKEELFRLLENHEFE